MKELMQGFRICSEHFGTLCIKKVFLVTCFFLLFRVKGSKKNESVLALVMISRVNLLKAARVTVEF